MAVVGSAVSMNDTWTASENADGSLNAQVRFQVTTDSLQDGPVVALTAPGLPALNSSYSVGNDSSTALFCMERSPNKPNRDGLIWHVNCRFSNINQQSGQEFDEAGNPEPDPTKWNKQIRIQTRSRQILCQDALWVEPNPNPRGFAIPRPAGVRGQVINSFGKPVDPPAMKDDSRLTIQVRKHQKTFSMATAETYKDKVNNDAWNLVHTDATGQVLNEVFPIGSCKMNNINAESFDWINPANSKIGIYYRVTFEFDFQRTQNRFFLDKGRIVLANAGRDDGRGQGISLGDLLAGMPRARQLTDPMGQIIFDDVPLNGKGDPLAWPDEEEAVLEWQMYEREPFAALGM